jgi:hypothetical protein
MFYVHINTWIFISLPEMRRILHSSLVTRFQYLISMGCIINGIKTALANRDTSQAALVSWWRVHFPTIIHRLFTVSNGFPFKSSYFDEGLTTHLRLRLKNILNSSKSKCCFIRYVMSEVINSTCQWLIDWLICFVLNATFINISAISRRPVLVVEEGGVPGENHRPWKSNW